MPSTSNSRRAALRETQAGMVVQLAEALSTRTTSPDRTTAPPLLAADPVMHRAKAGRQAGAQLQDLQYHPFRYG